MNTVVGIIWAGVGILMARILGEGKPTSVHVVAEVGFVLTHGGPPILCIVFFVLCHLCDGRVITIHRCTRMSTMRCSPTLLRCYPPGGTPIIA